MDAVVAALITAVVGGPVFYALGTRQRRLEGLYERRAQVIARLSELLYAVQFGFTVFANLFQYSGVDRKKQMQDANRAFDELRKYYFSNAVWLEPGICDRIESFMEMAYLTMGDYVDDLDERGYPQTAEGRALSRKMLGEIQPLRRDLENQFRAILYPPPWYDAPLRVLERIHTRNRQNLVAATDQTDRGSGGSKNLRE